MNDADDIEELAREALDLERLRPGQQETAEAAIAGRDVLGVMPTGYGKSAIYKLAAATIPGCTVVVSPLVALQRDQVEALDDEDVGEAAQINATIGDRARRDTFAALASGTLEFVFLAPEQLSRSDTIEALRAVAPSLFVIDEAHCISTWGHDFRPDYQRLADVIQEVGRPVVMALTATAAPPVRAEIIERLRLDDPLVVVRGFDRPNIELRVERHVDATAKDDALVERAAALAAGNRSGIVYVATRARTESLAEALRAAGVSAAAYHAGLPRRRRDEVHDSFHDGTATVVVATTAFGMGIDKPDVRFVLHGDVPESLDSYYQEIGRGGRDGEPATAILFYRPEDLGLRRFLGAPASIDPVAAREVFAALDRNGGAVSVQSLRELVDLTPRRLTALLNRLHDAGALRIEKRGRVIATEDMDLDAAIEAVSARGDARRQLEHSRVEMLRTYAESRGCRRRALLMYFGEQFAGPCDRCDNCEAGLVDDSSESGDATFPEGATVQHDTFGSGVVVRSDVDAIVVLFDDSGYRTLSVEAVLDHDLLTRVASE